MLSLERRILGPFLLVFLGEGFCREGFFANGFFGKVIASQISGHGLGRRRPAFRISFVRRRTWARAPGRKRLRRPRQRVHEVFGAEGEGAAFDEPFDGDAQGVGLFGVESEFPGDDAGFHRLVAGALHVVQHAA